MNKQHKPLNYSDLPDNSQLTENGNTVTEYDNALKVMTDFNKIKPFIIEELASIDFANSKMIACGVRLLFVTNTNNQLAGLITASDLLGEKPIKHLQMHGGSRNDILVKDIMTGRNLLKTLKLSDVRNADVGDIVETMKSFGRQHILITQDSGGVLNTKICGIFSTTQISRQLGKEIELQPKASTFSEVESALASSF